MPDRNSWPERILVIFVSVLIAIGAWLLSAYRTESLMMDKFVKQEAYTRDQDRMRLSMDRLEVKIDELRNLILERNR